MASAVGNQSSGTIQTKLTYDEMVESTKKFNAQFAQQITHLTNELAKPIADIQTLANQLLGEKKMSELGTLLTEQYERYTVMQIEREIAQQCLDTVNKAYVYCTPADVSFNQAQVDHLEKLGRDMQKLGADELQLSVTSGQLLTESKGLLDLIQKTDAYVMQLPIDLGSAARALKMSTRETRKVIDYAPDKVIGPKYFLDGLEAYKKAKSSTSAQESSTTH